jgi:hypothetical protein
MVVMANRQYEAWFLASIEALRGKAGILPDVASRGPRGVAARGVGPVK